MILDDQNIKPIKTNRIICLVPSLTELIVDLGLEENLVGITKFCVHPKSLKNSKTIIGGTKNINIDKIKELHPDLIIANKEENVKEQVEALAQTYPVLLTDINHFEDALQAIWTIGKWTQKEVEAGILIEAIKHHFENTDLKKINKAAYLIWKDPYMTIGGDTFIHDMMRICGLSNAFGEKSRYPEITLDDLSRKDIGVILLSSEPYPFSQKHISTLQIAFPDKKIILVDGEMFSWYGSRMKHMPDYFHEVHQKIENYVL